MQAKCEIEAIEFNSVQIREANSKREEQHRQILDELQEELDQFAPTRDELKASLEKSTNELADANAALTESEQALDSKARLLQQLTVTIVHWSLLCSSGTQRC